MFDLEFTHEGNLCTFEVLIERLRRQCFAPDREFIHDIDLKESKFGRPDGAHCFNSRSDLQEI